MIDQPHQHHQKPHRCNHRHRRRHDCKCRNGGSCRHYGVHRRWTCCCMLPTSNDCTVAGVVCVLIELPLLLVLSPNFPTAFPRWPCLPGCAGATFVTNQFWCSLMFAPNVARADFRYMCFRAFECFRPQTWSMQVVGTANATAAGWGNLGGGVTQQLACAFTSLSANCS